VASAIEKIFQNLRSESDIAFRQMADKFRENNGGKVYFELIKNGVYSVRIE